MKHHSGRPGLPLRIPSGSVKDTPSVEHPRRVEHRGAHQGRFHSPRRFSEARVRRKGPGAHGESTIFRRARSQPHLQHQKLRANQASSPGNTTHQQHHQRHINRITTTGNTTRQPPHQRRTPQRFLYCDGETPNISLKYFTKYFCVPKPTASETSTTLSPASADNSWAALLSRMVRMNTEGFIP